MRVRWHGAWGQRFPEVAGAAGFQVIVQGTCWLIPPDGAEPIALGVGDVLLFPHGHGYALADDPRTPLLEPRCDPLEDAELFASASVGEAAHEPTTITLCGGYRLDAGRAHPLLGDLPDLIHLPARVDRYRELRAAVELLAAEVDGARPGADTVAPALVDVLLVYILRAWFAERPAREAGGGWAAALADRPVAAALNAIHHDPARAWTVESLGAVAGLSRAAFAKRFGALVGRPPLAYLTWWRLTRAARLLRSSDASLGEVAARIGYASEFAFANAFKREYGTAPGRYRRGARDEAEAPRVPWPREVGRA